MLTSSSFDTIIPRRDTGSLKWDMRPELDPFWVADMDFVSPPAVLEALCERVEHGVFGYARPHDGLVAEVVGYLERRHGYQADTDDIVYLGGLVPALSLAARALGKSGDEVMTCTPVYPPFLTVAKDAQMKTVKVPHVLEDGQWSFDWEAMDAAVTERTKLFILCSPQNPLGRCFSAEEITRLAEWCLEKGIVLVADEVHCDLVLDEADTPFYSTLNLADKLRQNTIVLHSPSKTYNIAGLAFAYAIVENDRLRARFKAAKGHTAPEINCLAYYGAEAAYRDGESWRQELLEYLRGNRDVLEAFVKDYLPSVTMTHIQATYLAWLDCSKLGHDNPAQFVEKQSQIFVSDGAYFNSPQNIRFNFGCPRERVLEGLEKLRVLCE